MDVGFLGLGIMGSRMAANLVAEGHRVTAWTHTPGKAQAWAAEHGAVAADTPAQAAAGGDVVITMVVDGAQVESVLLGDGGAAAGARADALFVDMSTISPDDSRRIAGRLAEQGIRFVDAPVTGSSPRAQDGTLTIMAGGEAADVERARPLFEVMGKLIVHVGPVGMGESLKLVNNAVAAANTAAIAEGILLAKALGVDLDAFEAVLGGGSGGSAMLALKADPMRRHDFTTLFKLEHMLKDVRLCLQQAASTGVPFDAAVHAGELLEAGLKRGLGDADFAAILEVVEDRAGTRL